MANTLVPKELIVDMWSDYFTGKTVEFLLFYQNLTAIAVTLDAGADNFTAVGHSLLAGDEVILSAEGGAATPPPELELNRPYHVVNPATDTFQLGVAPGVDAIDFTTAGSGQIYVKKLVWGRAATTADVIATELPSANGYARQTLDLATNIAWSDAERAYVYTLPSPIIVTPSGGDLIYDGFALIDSANSVCVQFTWEDSDITITDGYPRAFPIQAKIAGGDYDTGAIE